MIILGSRKYRELLERLAMAESQLAALRADRPASVVARSIAKFSVVEVFDDYVTARHFDERASGDLVNVMKWFDVQKTPFDGNSLPDFEGNFFTYDYTDTQQRTKTRDSDSASETQVIIPRYVPEQTISGTTYRGSTILAALVIGGTGFAIGQSYSIDGDVPVWMEISPRAYGKKTGT